MSTLDNDRHVRVSETAITVVEEGANVTYTVVLQRQPTADTVQINVVESSDAITVDPDPPNLMFIMANWNEPQTVTVTAPDDTNTVSETVIIRHTIEADVGGYTPGLLTPVVTVTVTDNDE